MFERRELRRKAASSHRGKFCLICGLAGERGDGAFRARRLLVAARKTKTRAVRPVPATSPQGLRKTLRDVFGLSDFRPGQEEIITSVMSGRDTLAILPTGAGKSLCYQLPALHLPGMTVVASPLISLMKDQTEKLDGLGLSASQLNSAMPADETRAAIDGVAADRAEFLLTTPERLGDAAFLETISDKRIDLFVVDEAHCISQWGHDFRPSFLGLGDVARTLGRPPILALTATAPPQVVGDIVKQLGLNDPSIINTGIYRPNLHYEATLVAGDDDKQRHLGRLMQELTGTGIVYCSTVRHVEAVTIRLREMGVDVARYHGRLAAGERRENQERFMRGELRAIVATNAFGMGIDKPDIRWIVHYNIPGSLDAYYQESGRAGRDGLESRCILLYQRADRGTQAFFMAGRYPRFNDIAAVHTALEAMHAADDPVALGALQSTARDVSRTKVRVVLSLLKQLGIVRESRGSRFRLIRRGIDAAALEAMARGYEERQQKEVERLDRMVMYAQTALCRWKVLLDYFGEEPPADGCGHCDGCHLRPSISALSGTREQESRPD